MVLLLAFNYVVRIIYILIIARIIMSFISRDFHNPIVRFIYQVTEPLLVPFRNLISKFNIDTGMIDLSPILLIFFLRLVKMILRTLVGVWL